MVSFPQVSPPEPCAHLSPPPYATTCPAYLILLDFTRTISGKEYRSLRFSLCNFLHSPVTLSLLGPNTLLNTLFSNTLSLCSSLNVNDPLRTDAKKHSGIADSPGTFHFKYPLYHLVILSLNKISTAVYTFKWTRTIKTWPTCKRPSLIPPFLMWRVWITCDTNNERRMIL